MLQKFNDAESELDNVLDKMQKKARQHSFESGTQNPIDATEAALVDLKEILAYFRKNFLDKDGKFVKISVLKWVFVKKYRDKIGAAINFLVEKIKTIASRFK